MWNRRDKEIREGWEDGGNDANLLLTYENLKKKKKKRSSFDTSVKRILSKQKLIHTLAKEATNKGCSGRRQLFRELTMGSPSSNDRATTQGTSLKTGRKIVQTTGEQGLK